MNKRILFFWILSTSFLIGQSANFDSNIDITTSIAFGIKMNTIEEEGGVIQDHLEKIFPMLFSRINKPIPFYKIIRSKKDKQFDHALREIHLFIDEIIQKGKKRIEENPHLKLEPGNVLEAILVAAETMEGFGDEEVKGNLLTLLMAGEDTTAHTLAWSITELVQNPSAIKALQAEITSLREQLLEAIQDKTDLSSIA